MKELNEYTKQNKTKKCIAKIQKKKKKKKKNSRGYDWNFHL